MIGSHFCTWFLGVPISSTTNRGTYHLELQLTSSVNYDICVFKDVAHSNIVDILKPSLCQLPPKYFCIRVMSFKVVCFVVDYLKDFGIAKNINVSSQWGSLFVAACRSNI